MDDKKHPTENGPVAPPRGMPVATGIAPGTGNPSVTLSESSGDAGSATSATVSVEHLIRALSHPRVTMERSARAPTKDEILWMVIRNSTNSLGFDSYSRFIDDVLCNHRPSDASPNADRKAFLAELSSTTTSVALPFPGVDPYRLLKVATEVFLMTHCGVSRRFDPQPLARASGRREAAPQLGGELDDDCDRVGNDLPVTRSGTQDLPALWSAYLQDCNGAPDLRALPYLDIILQKLPGVPLVGPVDSTTINCYGILKTKLSSPCFAELIWCYWQEEGMLVQTMNAISRRFQNRRGPGSRDPLAQLEIDPLLPLNDLFWGYLQDEQHRLSVLRRACEYDHQYGLKMEGLALRRMRTADSRSKFLEAFHNLIYKCILFYRQDDDTTVIADGFAVLNAVRETHYILAQAASNQFGGMAVVGRQEMLIQQWLLSRPEMRQFLGGRVMVPYPEPWMDRVDAMKTLQGWTDTSVMHFRDLAAYGEQLLLSVRYGDWSNPQKRPDHAANWARAWRSEMQGYAHAYRAATGVDLTSDVVNQRAEAERYLPPSVHLRNRMAMQRKR